MKNKLTAVVTALCAALCICGCDGGMTKSVQMEIPNLRDHYTQIKGDGNDTVTIMMYMIGSDLETDGGAASADIDEILSAGADNINIVFQTGGTLEWTNPSIGDGVTERHIAENGTLVKTADLGNISMVSPATLTDFITDSAAKYPADRYELILWNHGGGTVMGFGSDEMHPDEMLELSEIGEALKNSGIKFDTVGFDACLMGTIETAYMLEPYADYMIASEEYEPGTGWYYTDWLEALSADTSISTIELGTQVVDDFIYGPDSSFWDSNTLSVVELREIPNVYERLCTLLAKTQPQLKQNYSEFSSARYNCKAFGDGDFEQIDITSYLNELDDDGGSRLAEAVNSAVKYYGSTDYDSYGLAMYFPYDYPEYYSDLMAQMNKFGYGEECEPFFDEFLSILAGGQQQYAASDYSDNAFGQGAETTDDYDDYSWYDESWFDESWYDDSQNDEAEIESIWDYDELEVTDKGEYFALSLSDEDWENINGIAIWVYLDDGEGYIDLGEDNMYEFDDDGDLMVDFDYTWISLDGQPVPYYFEYETPDGADEWYTYGYVPATLADGTEIEIMVYWDDDHPMGYVPGYRTVSDSETLSAPQKGLKEFKNGDVIDFSCDYYTYDGNYDGVYSFGENLTVNGDIEVSYEDIGDFTTNICYELTDIYNNSITTEMIELIVE